MAISKELNLGRAGEYLAMFDILQKGYQCFDSGQGATYDLQDVAELIYADGMASINRVNQEKQIELNYRFVQEAESSKDLLEAYRIEIDEIISSYKL